MKLLPQWLREFVDVPTDDARLARDLTQAGFNIEGATTEQGQTIFEAEITTNRADAMNHYGVARECAAIYDAELKTLSAHRPTANGQPPTAAIEIADATGCARYTARVIRAITIGASPAAIGRPLEL